MKIKGNLWKITLVIVMGIMMATMFVGCSSSADNKSAASSSGDTTTDKSLAKIKEKGKLVVGVNAEFAPFEFHTMIDGKDTVVGFDMDLAKEIAKDMGVKLEIKELSFDALLTTLQSGQVDVIISGLSATEERRKTLDFSDPYYNGSEVLLTTKENLSKFNSFNDLKNQKIGIQLSSLQDKLMGTLLPDGNYTKIDSMNTLFLSLKSNQVDGLVASKVVSEMAVEANPEFVIADKVQIDDSSLNSPGVAVALRKNSTALQTQINSTIKRLKESGKMDGYVNEACKLAGISQKK
ncbi:MAG: transporter substrate-binding domain-containing protein [Selenomonadaceae bacterium]